MGKDKTKDGDAATSTETSRDHSRDQEARDATLAKTIIEAVARETQTITEVFAREMAKAHVQYQATIKENCAPTPPSTLKVTSGSNGFRIMDPFDWTMDKTIYQRWQLWSHKARLALDAMEGDSENTKISYFHHWINGEGISKIEGWKNNKTLISQSDYDALEDKTGKYSSEKIESYFKVFELSLTPRSNPLLAVEDLYLAKQGSMTSGEFHSHILKIVKRCQFPCQKAEERAIGDAIFMGMNSQWARDKAINLMNEEEKEVTVEFLMNHLAVEDGNTQHKFLFKKLLPEVKISVCPHEIQNFGNSIADISILGQFCTYLQFRGEKYLNTFIVTNANDCPNLLSHGATFRMGVLLPNYLEENVVKSACGENVPNLKYSTSTGTSSNVFQILQDLWLKQYQENHPDSLQNESRKS